MIELVAERRIPLGDNLFCDVVGTILESEVPVFGLTLGISDGPICVKLSNFPPTTYTF